MPNPKRPAQPKSALHHKTNLPGVIDDDYMPSRPARARVTPPKPERTPHLFPLWQINWLDHDNEDRQTTTRAMTKTEALAAFWERHPSAAVRSVAMLAPDAAGVAGDKPTHPAARSATLFNASAVDSLPATVPPFKRPARG